VGVIQELTLARSPKAKEIWPSLAFSLGWQQAGNPNFPRPVPFLQRGQDG
jgi:hypothetical protein